MFEELRKKAVKAVTAGSIVMFIIGVGLIIFMGKYAFYGIVGYRVFEQLEPDEIKGKLVDVTLYNNFDYFYYEGTEYTDTGRKTINYYYYVILTGNEASEDVRFMTIKVPASYHSKMDKMCENTFNGLLSEPLYFSGSVRKLTGNRYDAYREYLDYLITGIEGGLTDEEFNEIAIPYYIQVEASRTSMTIMGIIVTLGGLFLIIFGIVRIIKANNGAQLKKFRATIAAAGYTENMVESDFNSAQSFTKKGTIKVGRLFIYNTSSSTPVAIPNSKMLWAYQITTTHRTNGIKTGTTYSLNIFVDGYKNNFNISVPNEATAIAILDKIANTLPWVVVGFTDQISNLFHKNRAQFLALRYNTMEHTVVEDPFGGQQAFIDQQGTGNNIEGSNQ